MHVDGFRFDLGTILGARAARLRPAAAASSTPCRQDPVLSQVKLIAEPWDLGPGGYQVGGFPPGWAEWNDRYRDTVRAYWKGDDGHDRRARARGSPARPTSSTSAAAGPGPASTSSPRTTASRCTTSSRYNDKHNEANGEDNRDGIDDNRSLELRRRGRRPTTRRSSRCASGRSATCWRRCCCRRARRCCWPATSSAARSTATTTPTARTTRSPGSTGTRRPTRERAARRSSQRLIALRREHPVFRRRDFFRGAAGRRTAGQGHRLAARPTAREMTDEDWATRRALRSASCCAATAGELDATGGRRELDDELPAAVQRAPRRPDSVHAAGRRRRRGAGTLVLDTADDGRRRRRRQPAAAARAAVRSLRALARCCRAGEPRRDGR